MSKYFILFILVISVFNGNDKAVKKVHELENSYKNDIDYSIMVTNNHYNKKYSLKEGESKGLDTKHIILIIVIALVVIGIIIGVIMFIRNKRKRDDENLYDESYNI